jgi:hypothetical protein
MKIAILLLLAIFSTVSFSKGVIILNAPDDREEVTQILIKNMKSLNHVEIGDKFTSPFKKRHLGPIFGREASSDTRCVYLSNETRIVREVNDSDIVYDIYNSHKLLEEESTGEVEKCPKTATTENLHKRSDFATGEFAVGKYVAGLLTFDPEFKTKVEIISQDQTTLKVKVQNQNLNITLEFDLTKAMFLQEPEKEASEE